MASGTTREERIAHANALIQIIASHGRRFFMHQPRAKNESGILEEPRFARLELRNGRIYYIDDYTQKAVYTYQTKFRNSWHGFSHGGTLKNLVECMVEYIRFGTKVPKWMIVIQQMGRETLEGNIWGYDFESAIKVREEAYLLPIIGD